MAYPRADFPSYELSTRTKPSHSHIPSSKPGPKAVYPIASIPSFRKENYHSGAGQSSSQTTSNHSSPGRASAKRVTFRLRTQSDKLSDAQRIAQEWRQQNVDDKTTSSLSPRRRRTESAAERLQRKSATELAKLSQHTASVKARLDRKAPAQFDSADFTAMEKAWTAGRAWRREEEERRRLKRRSERASAQEGLQLLVAQRTRSTGEVWVPCGRAAPADVPADAAAVDGLHADMGRALARAQQHVGGAEGPAALECAAWAIELAWKAGDPEDYERHRTERATRDAALVRKVSTQSRLARNASTQSRVRVAEHDYVRLVVESVLASSRSPNEVQAAQDDYRARVDEARNEQDALMMAGLAARKNRSPVSLAARGVAPDTDMPLAPFLTVPAADRKTSAASGGSSSVLVDGAQFEMIELRSPQGITAAVPIPVRGGSDPEELETFEDSGYSGYEDESPRDSVVFCDPWASPFASVEERERNASGTSGVDPLEAIVPGTKRLPMSLQRDRAAIAAAPLHVHPGCGLQTELGRQETSGGPKLRRDPAIQRRMESPAQEAMRVALMNPSGSLKCSRGGCQEVVATSKDLMRHLEIHNLADDASTIGDDDCLSNACF